METTKTIETINYLVFMTKTHKFRIKEESFKTILEKKNSAGLLSKVLSRGLRPIIDNPTGEEWQQSFNEIFKLLCEGN